MLISASALHPALHDAKLSVMNFLNEIAQQYPDAISFAPGRPMEQYFDVAGSLDLLQDFSRRRQPAVAAARQDSLSGLGQYGRTNGMIGDLIARLLKKDEGLIVEGADIVVTVGCQEAMCICLIALCGHPDDVALVCDPAYIGFAGAARMLNVAVAPVQLQPQGLDLEALEATLNGHEAAGKRPRLLYLSPDFANPTGATLPPGQRSALVDLARRRGLLLLEDHAYNYFQYDGERAPPLKALPDADHVLYLGSFSKSVYPGVRLGYIATNARIVGTDGQSTTLADELSKIKSLLTVNTSPLCQGVVGGLLLKHDCSLLDYVAPRRDALQASRDAMLDALGRHFAGMAGVHWNRPAGGFFLTLALPFTVTSDDLLRSARDYGVLWTPMSYFYDDARPGNDIRLSFSYVTPTQIDSGIAALARLVRQRMADTKHP